ncbi:M14 family zinc carboxypeptidase [Paenibacillus sp. J5C_2022]|uniref:M14 family zinc carboxypeptidase n=1 Tax=Paenibacillus sp. J5C2022 TaxID=2977129 RepID=UPI0021D36649|nr:M14 family zinc carboxypeptidase [Paenibacillus sp. J5C2022]MCU6709113.1 M14 family zinc carboxypeptidase [Paenibacillus sp. J5C2022]
MKPDSIQIHCDYPGGNIIWTGVEGNTVFAGPDLHGGPWWFYWSFRLEGPAGELVTIQMNDEVIGPWGPAFSTDRMHWNWLGEESRIDTSSFRFRIPQEGGSFYFSFGLPYQLSHFHAFAHSLAHDPLVSVKTLTVSEGGRDIPLMSVGSTDAKRHGLLLGRHHACEAVPAYTVEGLLRALLEQYRPCLEGICFHYVPFVDIDGVEEGLQGKTRQPHDHNRDYTEQPRYAATKAIMALIDTYSYDIGLDWHSPFRWGDRNDHFFFVLPESPAREEAVKLSRLLTRAAARLQQANGPALRYDPVWNIEPGKDWNLPGKPTCSAYMRARHIPLATTLESPYFGTPDSKVTIESARQFGAVFAAGLMDYLASS